MMEFYDLCFPGFVLCYTLGIVLQIIGFLMSSDVRADMARCPVLLICTIIVASLCWPVLVLMTPSCCLDRPSRSDDALYGEDEYESLRDCDEPGSHNEQTYLVRLAPCKNGTLLDMTKHGAD